MYQVNYTHSMNKARLLQRTGFGKTTSIRNYYLSILNRIDLDELTQMVAIAAFRASKESKNFYACLSNELGRIGVFKNRGNKQFIDFDTTDLKEDVKVRQLRNLYSAIGFDLFYKYLKIETPRSTVQKWAWKAFAKRKDEERISRTQKREIEKILKEGGRIRFSKTSSSVYIENNEIKIRISDHNEGSNQDFDKNIIISC